RTLSVQKQRAKRAPHLLDEMRRSRTVSARERLPAALQIGASDRLVQPVCRETQGAELRVEVRRHLEQVAVERDVARSAVREEYLVRTPARAHDLAQKVVQGRGDVIVHLIRRLYAGMVDGVTDIDDGRP